MGLIYYKGDPYGDGYIDLDERLEFYAIEGEPQTPTGEIIKEIVGQDEHGNPIYRINIPMGTTIENAFATDTIETHIVEDSERVRLQADVGTRLKWGNRPAEGIIAGGLRVLTRSSSLVDQSITSGAIPVNAKCKDNIANYVYSDVLFPRCTNCRSSINPVIEWFSESSYWIGSGTSSEPERNWREYQFQLSMKYSLNTSNDPVIALPGYAVPWYLGQTPFPSGITIDDKKIILSSSVNSKSYSSIGSGRDYLPALFGGIFILNQILTFDASTSSASGPANANDLVYADVTCYITSLSNNPNVGVDDYAYICDRSVSMTQSTSSIYNLYLPMSEDEVRYAMGVQDLFDQISYEEYIHHLPSGD